MVKIERSFPEPESLREESKKKTGICNTAEVLQRLRQDFNDKCYICEIKDSDAFEVEHLLPHHNKKIPERYFDWNNIFLACRHCNEIKNCSIYEENIIDCCKEDPEVVIDFIYDENRTRVVAKDSANKKAVITAKLCNEVFNDKHTPMRDFRSEIKSKKLSEEMNALLDNLKELRENPNLKVVHRKLKGLLARSSQFAAFKREYIRRNYSDNEKIMSYID